MTTPFDLQGQLSIDYSALDGLKPEIDRRVEGVAGMAKVDVDAKGAETALGHLESRSKDTRKEVEKPLKLDADTASVSRKLDKMRSAWANKWNYAIDQLAERLSKMKVGDSAAGAFGGLLSGAIIVETIFAWPGMGRYLISGITGKDFPTVQGAVIAISATFVLVNLVVDLIYTALDPRVQYQ